MIATRRTFGVLLAGMVLVVLAAPGASAAFNGEAIDDTMQMSAFEAEQTARRFRAADPAMATTRYVRAPMCNVGTGGGVEVGDADEAFGAGDTDGDGRVACGPSNTTVPVPVCVDGPPVLPLWRQQRAEPTDPWPAAWTLAFGYSCPEDAVPTFTAADFRRLPLAPPVLRMQPDRGWVLVNMDTVVMTDPAEQSFRTDLLGYGIDVIATPATYRYDFGDNSADLITTSPGHEWPNHDTSHIYEKLGTVQVTLTTTWKGRYRVDGTTVWHDVIGTATTSTTSTPFTVEERRSRLVGDLCTDVPKPDDC